MPETIGQRLKQIRTSRQISLEKAAEATRVRPHYLQALEEDNYSVMSSAAQGRGFLHLYADFLGLDLDAAMTEMRQSETADATPAIPAPESVTPPPAPVSTPQAPPASPADGKPDRRPFWARLLRRSVPEPDVADATPAPESGDSAAEEIAPVTVAAPEPVFTPEPEPEPQPDPVHVVSRAKKPAVKKSKAPSKVSKPKSKPRTTVKTTAKKPRATASLPDKKKVTRKTRSSKNSR